MFSKLFLIAAIGTGAVGTGAIGTGAVAGIAPTGVEFAAGPVRIEAGNGKFITAQLAEHTSLRLTLVLKDDRQLQIKF